MKTESEKFINIITELEKNNPDIKKEGHTIRCENFVMIPIKNKVNCKKCFYSTSPTIIGADCIFLAIKYNEPAIERQKVKNKNGDCKDFKKYTIWLKLKNKWLILKYIFNNQRIGLIIGSVIGTLLTNLLYYIFKGILK